MKKRNAKEISPLKNPARFYFGKNFDEISALLPKLKYMIMISVQEGYIYCEKKQKIFFCFDEKQALVSITTMAINVFPNMYEDIPLTTLAKVIGDRNIISASEDGVEFNHTGYNFFYTPGKAYDLRMVAPVMVKPI